MPRSLRSVLLLLCCLGLAGCESTDNPPSQASQRGLTTIPWNRPAKWEGGGVLGSQMGAMRGY